MALGRCTVNEALLSPSLLWNVVDALPSRAPLDTLNPVPLRTPGPSVEFLVEGASIVFTSVCNHEDRTVEKQHLRQVGR